MPAKTRRHFGLLALLVLALTVAVAVARWSMNSTSGLPKVVTSAVCYVPPESVWPQIQAVRRVHDKAFVRWMPHVGDQPTNQHTWSPSCA